VITHLRTIDVAVLCHAAPDLGVNDRTVDATDPGDAVALAAIFGLVWLLGSVWAGAWLAARLSGRELGVGFAQSFRVLIGLRSHMSNPAAAWPSPASHRLPGPWVLWPCTALVGIPVPALAILIVARRNRARFGLVERVRLGVPVDARMASVDDLAPLYVTTKSGGRFVFGRAHDRLVGTEAPGPVVRSGYRPARGSLMAVGPSQCGKTTMAIGGIVRWDGPAILSSVKTDLLTATLPARGKVGVCKVFDPTGITGQPQASWSPLRGAQTVDGAQAAARALVDCAPRSGDADVFWFQEAEIVLAGYMWLAANTDRQIVDVVRWVFIQDGGTGDGEVEPLLLALLSSTNRELAAQAMVVAEFLGGIWNLEGAMRASVFGTAQAAVWPWTSPKVVASSGVCEIDLEWLLSGVNTVYACAPLRAAKRLAPALGGLIGDLLEQVAEHCARTGRPLDPPLLLVLDEVGNTPLRDLPELVSTLAGLGVQIVTIWQSVAQIKAAYKDQAGTIIANHRTMLFYSGIRDPDTYDLATRLVGDEEIVNRQLTTDLGTGGSSARQAVAESTTTSTLVPGHVLRQQPTGSALCIHGNLPPIELRAL
jgi:type IV secretion system protein VirD4